MSLGSHVMQTPQSVLVQTQAAPSPGHVVSQGLHCIHHLLWITMSYEAVTYLGTHTENCLKGSLYMV